MDGGRVEDNLAALVTLMRFDTVTRSWSIVTRRDGGDALRGGWTLGGGFVAAVGALYVYGGDSDATGAPLDLNLPAVP